MDPPVLGREKAAGNTCGGREGSKRSRHPSGRQVGRRSVWARRREAREPSPAGKGSWVTSLFWYKVFISARSGSEYSELHHSLCLPGPQVLQSEHF